MKTRKIRRFLSIVAISAAALIGIQICMRVVEQRKAAAAILEPADISIWVCADAGESVSEKRVILEEALAEFQEDYPQITIEIQCMEKQEYEMALHNSVKQGTAPTLFDSSCLMQEDFGYLEDISVVFDFINTGDYWFLNRYTQFFPNEKQLPMAFQMPAVYYNTLVNAEGKQAKELVEEGNFLVCKEGFLTWYNLYQAGEPVSNFLLLEETEPAWDQVTDKEQFLEGERACLIADTSIYSWVQANLPGIYKMGFFETKGMIGSFQDYFSISSTASEEEKQAAVQVLVYLLADTAQDVCYVQNGDCVPLNKKIYAAYVEINREFENLSDGIPIVEMAGENQAFLDMWMKQKSRQER